MTLTSTTPQRQVTFEVTTTRPVALGDQIFVTGNAPELGAWQADGFPLTRTSDNLWQGTVALAETEDVEFKITRGSWATEALSDEGHVPANHHLSAEEHGTVSLTVSRWKDTPAANTHHIAGTFHIHESFHSQHLRFDRTVIVWLPPSYATHPDRTYPVLYMQHGEQVFEPPTSRGNQDLEMDEWCLKLIGAGHLPEIIVVAVHATEDHFVEYDPSQAGPSYARFMIKELKPFIDRHYRTRAEPPACAVAGTSLGGTISFYVAWSRPDLFGAAACLSPVFQFHNNELPLEMVRRTPRAPALKMYLSCGQGDDTERALTKGILTMKSLLEDRGLQKDRTLMVVKDREGIHAIGSWWRRSPEWLPFIFGSAKKARKTAANSGKTGARA